MPFFNSLCTRPTGNWRPAFDERDWDFEPSPPALPPDEDLPAFPLPDIVDARIGWVRRGKVSVGVKVSACGGCGRRKEARMGLPWIAALYTGESGKRNKVSGGLHHVCVAAFVPFNKDASRLKQDQRIAFVFIPSHIVGLATDASCPRPYHLTPTLLAHPPPLSSLMAPKPASTAGKAPASTASKAPAKSTEGAKAAKKTAKAAAPADGEKKKRKKVRKETYSSYIYKGTRLSRYTSN